MYQAKRHLRATHMYLYMDGSLVATHRIETGKGEKRRVRSIGLLEATNLGEQKEEWME